MQYALIIAARADSYQREFPQIPRSSAEQRKQLAELVQELVDTDVLVQTIALGHPSDSRIVTVRDGGTKVTGGLPDEEVAAGLFIVEAADEAAAVAIAARFPGAANAHVQVRPVVPVPIEALTKAAVAA